MEEYQSLLSRSALWLSVLGLVALVYDFGFSQPAYIQQLLEGLYFLVLGVGVISTAARYWGRGKLFDRRKVLAFDVLSLCFTLWIYYLYLFVGVPFETDLLLENPIWIRLAILLTFVREISEVTFNYRRTYLNPGQLFVASFLLIILLGAFLLTLPNATHGGLSMVDALFTSTSAVCVTGLIVVDTGSYFTEFGQVIILSLIQIGGLGILTFASYFSYFFKGGASYGNQVALSTLTSQQKLGEVFSILKHILLITFTIEIIAGTLIYSSLGSNLLGSHYDRVFFSIFHAVSAFCNAGFSTLPAGLAEEGFRFNYFLHLVVILTFVIGGLGFPIVSNLIRYIRYRVKSLLPLAQETTDHRPWLLTLNSRITLVTTLSISAIAFLVFYVLEYNNTLADHEGIGKVVTALFGATTPRTAGFNTIDTSAMLFPTTMMVFVLMWIGASPASTGGGIKTSTFAIAILNILSMARGKNRIEVFRREVANSSVQRAFAVMALSLIVIGFGIMLISIFDSDKTLMAIGFECFSAYSTVGLSLGITADLSTPSKLIIMVIMFVGRVNALTILIAVLKTIRPAHYRYPSEELTIN